MKIKEIFKLALEACKEHSPELLTGLGIGGMITSTIVAVMATPKAMKKIEEKKEELGKEDLSAKETIVATWKCYIPAVVTAAASTAALIGSTSISLKRNTALAATLAISETARREFEQKAKEVVGEKKVNQIKEEVAKEDMKQSYTASAGGMMISSVIGNGSSLFWMRCTNQWFMGDHETVRQKINNLNFRMTNGNEPYITMDELCDEFMLPHVPLGGRLRWDANKRLLDPRFYTDWAPDGRPCGVIDFDEDDYLNLR